MCEGIVVTASQALSSSVSPACIHVQEPYCTKHTPCSVWIGSDMYMHITQVW